MDDQPGGPEQGSHPCPRSYRTRFETVSAPDRRDRLRQRIGVHNSYLLSHCETNKITFTRSRPGNKNDFAHLEQKNWTHVRTLVGHLRFTNLLCTQQKLISHERVGAKLIKRHDRVQTPYQGTIDAGVLTAVQHRALTRTRNQLKPGQLERQIGELVVQLERLALSKAPSTSPRINRAYKT